MRLWLLASLPLDNDRREQAVYLPQSSPEVSVLLVGSTLQ